MRGPRRTTQRPSEVVLLGSVATGKYVDVLLSVLGDRLRFPAEFAGRGDMSRGGLMLRKVDEGEELTYVPIAGSARVAESGRRNWSARGLPQRMAPIETLLRKDLPMKVGDIVRRATSQIDQSKGPVRAGRASRNRGNDPSDR